MAKKTNQMLIFTVEDYAKGIPQLAAVFNIDESFGVYRSFFPQANRILLGRMIELYNLAEKQLEFDTRDVPSHKLHTITTDDKDRIELERDIEMKMNEYCMTFYHNDVTTSC